MAIENKKLFGITDSTNSYNSKNRVIFPAMVDRYPQNVIKWSYLYQDPVADTGYSINTITITKSDDNTLSKQEQSFSLGGDVDSLISVSDSMVQVGNGTDTINLKTYNRPYVNNNEQLAYLSDIPEVDLTAYQTKEDQNLNTTSKVIVGAINEVNQNITELTSDVEDILEPYTVNLTNLLTAQDSESISTAIGGIDNLNATVTKNQVIFGTLANGTVAVGIRVLGNQTTLTYFVDSLVGLTVNEVIITNTSGTLSKTVNTHSVLTENMVINSLTSDETTLPLSAAQGKVLATDKQDKTDNTLGTTDKTIVGAINEISSKITGIGKPSFGIGGEIFNNYADNQARGNYAHAEGSDTNASGDYSHAEGYNTIASGNYSHVEGKWNFDGPSAIHIVGIGTSSSDRKNAHVIDFAGDHYIYGVGGFDGTNSESAKSLREVINHDKAENFTVGTGLEMTPERVLNITLDTTVFFVAEQLPESPTDEQKKKICLIPAVSSSVNNEYTEYVWVVDDTHPNGYWEEFGTYTSEVDLTDYLKSADAASTYLSKTDAASTYATQANLTAHTGNTENPHNVTAAQLGLGNVNNTSDADKPISTATQNALDAKQATLVSGTNIKTLNGESLLGSGNITTYTPNSIDVTTLFADTASIASGISTQIAALGNSGVTEFPVLYAGSAIGNIKPTWIRTTSGVTNMMCIADNKIWYFEIQGTTVQRAELAIS